MDTDLSKAWAKWLGEKPWDYFLTVTFRDPLPPYRVEPVLNAVARTLLRFGPASLFLGAEQHISRFMHLHGLFRNGLVEIRPSDLWLTLFDTYGRAEVEPVRSRNDVSNYCTKYCTKGLAYYQFW